MSVRAYRVLNVEYSPQETFNLWHDEDFVGALDFSQLNEDGGGYIEFKASELREAVQAIKDKDERTRIGQLIEKDIDITKGEIFVKDAQRAVKYAMAMQYKSVSEVSDDDVYIMYTCY